MEELCKSLTQHLEQGLLGIMRGGQSESVPEFHKTHHPTFKTQYCCGFLSKQKQLRSCEGRDKGNYRASITFSITFWTRAEPAPGQGPGVEEAAHLKEP